MNDLEQLLAKKKEREQELKNELKLVRKDIKSLEEKIEFGEFKKWKKKMLESGLSFDDLGGLFNDN